VEAVVALLTEDVTLTMPPMPTWYRGREAAAVFLREWAFAKTWAGQRGRFEAGERHVRLVPARASGQVAFGAYHRDGRTGRYCPTALQVLTLRGERIGEIAGFVSPALVRGAGLPQEPDRRGPT
jgi:RNA polymerase sigma-70 factor (ECF subfamily)